MKVRIFILMVIMTFVGRVVVFANELVLVKGKGVPVCEAHLKNQKNMDLYEMACKRDEYYLDAKGITRPRWDKLDLRENKKLVKLIHKFFSYGDQFVEMEIMDDEKQFEKLMEVIYLKTHALYETAVDIDNDGKKEKIILYSDGFCMDSHAYSRPILVLEDPKNIIDVQKTEPLLQNPFGVALKSKVQGSNYQLYDVFFYRDKTYFDKWNMGDETLIVYRNLNGKTKEVCKYNYIIKNKEDNNK